MTGSLMDKIDIHTTPPEPAARAARQKAERVVRTVPVRASGKRYGGAKPGGREATRRLAQMARRAGE